MRFKIILIAILLTSLTSCKNTEGPEVLYLGHTLPQTHPVHKGMLEFQKALEKKSSGTLKVKIFPDGQLGSERELLELLQIGSVAATKVSAATLSNFVPEYNVMGIPYLFRDKGNTIAIICFF